MNETKCEPIETRLSGRQKILPVKLRRRETDRDIIHKWLHNSFVTRLSLLYLIMFIVNH